MERRPRSPTGRNAPKSGLESGFRKRGNEPSKGKSNGNFQTRDGKEGFRADDGKRAAPRGDRPARSFDDKPKRDFSDKPKRSYSDKPERGGYADKPKRDYGDRPQRSFDDKPKRDHGDRPQRSFDDRPKRDTGDRPQRSYADKPRGDFADKPKRSYADKPERGGYADKPKKSYDDRPKRDFGDKPKRTFGDRPQRSFDDRPKRDFGDRPQRSFADKPRGGYADKPKRDFGGDRNREERPRFSGPRIEVSVYGIHAVQAALLNPDRKIRAIYATEQDLADLQPTLDRALEDGLRLPDVSIVEREALNRALPRDAVHQGVGIDAEPLEETLLHDVIRKAAVKKKSTVLILDQVTDPHNIGAIIRSACAFGADAIVVQSRNAPELSGLISKTASGAAEYLPLVYETNLSRAIDELKEGGYFCLALDERGENIADAPAYEKTVLVLGAEGPGLRPLIKDHCDLLVRLPTSGPISSLNVSNAAAISLFAIASKRQK